jgi:hypothetical protein
MLAFSHPPEIAMNPLLSAFRLPTRLARAALGIASALLLAACVAYAPAPAPQPSTYDRAYNAMLGALSDQGVRVAGAQPSSGVITGTRGSITVIATVAPRPDGSVEVSFKTRGNIDEDPKLIDRVAASYNARMGR